MLQSLSLQIEQILAGVEARAWTLCLFSIILIGAIPGVETKVCVLFFLLSFPFFLSTSFPPGHAHWPQTKHESAGSYCATCFNAPARDDFLHQSLKPRSLLRTLRSGCRRLTLNFYILYHHFCPGCCASLALLVHESTIPAILTRALMDASRNYRTIEPWNYRTYGPIEL